MSTAGVDDPGFNRGERRRLFRFPDEHGDEDCKDVLIYQKAGWRLENLRHECGLDMDPRDIHVTGPEI